MPKMLMLPHGFDEDASDEEKALAGLALFKIEEDCDLMSKQMLLIMEVWMAMSLIETTSPLGSQGILERQAHAC